MGIFIVIINAISRYLYHSSTVLDKENRTGIVLAPWDYVINNTVREQSSTEAGFDEAERMAARGELTIADSPEQVNL